jgi:diacylglycerol kinase (ATP)
MQFLRRPGISCVLKPTASAGHARCLAAEAVAAGCSTVVVAGGDGTLNEVLDGLADVPGGLTKVRLGMLPVGTANVFAKEHGLPEELASAWAVILQGRERRIDLVRIEGQRLEGRRHGVFVQMSGAGLDARAIEKVTWALKQRWGPWAYVWTACAMLRESQPEIQVVLPEGRVSGQLVLVGNGQYYGGRFRLFDEAANNDGLLDCLVFPKVNWSVIGRTFAALACGHGPPKTCASYFQTRSLELSSQVAVPYELDGELAGQLPIKMMVEPGAVRLMIP